MTEDGVFLKFPHRIGRSILLYGKRSTSFPRQMFVGPDWPCMMFTYALITVPTVLFIKGIAIRWNIGVVAVSVFLLALTLR